MNLIKRQASFIFFNSFHIPGSQSVQKSFSICKLQVKKARDCLNLACENLPARNPGRVSFCQKHGHKHAYIFTTSPGTTVSVRQFSSDASREDNDTTSVIKQIHNLKLQMEMLREQMGAIKENQKKKGTGDAPYVVLFEGNIGCGKSTCLEHIRTKYPEVEASVEPIDKWTNIGGHNALALLYEDYKRWCFQFESYALLTRLQQHLQTSRSPVKLLERSLFSTMHIFIENDKNNGDLHPMEYAMLKQWFDWIVNDVGVTVDLIVYLQSSPEVCLSRTRERDRKEEKNVELAYIQDLHQRYEDWLVKKLSPVPAPVLVLDANQPLDDILLEVDRRKTDIFFGTC